MEKDLRQEQKGMQEVLCEKQRVIESQERHIVSLDAANRRLRSTLEHIKEHQRGPSGNGMVVPRPSLLCDNERKSSSC